MPSSQPDLINIADLTEVLRWMRHFNISKEELLTAVEKFGPSADAISTGLQKEKRTAGHLN